MKELKSFGSWAIVTGASSGIGKEFARQLAESGINLVLFARRENLLQTIAGDFRSRYGVEVKYAKLDLTEDNFLDTIEETINGLDVRMLISNAGAAHMGAFNKVPRESLENMVLLNVNAQLKITHWFTSELLKKGQKGGIVLLSSTVAYQGIPYAANYSAAKAYILNLGEALNYELKDKNIHVSVTVPGPTDAPGLTERTDADMADNLPMKPQPVDKLVREGLKALVKNKPVQIGGTMNRNMTKMMGRMMSRKGATAFWGKMMYKMVHLR